MELAVNMVTTTHIEQHAAAYEPGVLKPQKHHKLVEVLGRICAFSGVRREYVTTSMAAHGCTGVELEYVRTLRKQASQGKAGLLYVGQKKFEQRMMAVAGACLRNYIQARVVTLQMATNEVKEGVHNDASVLLIPNFATMGKTYATSEWDAGYVFDLLVHRYAQSLQTVLAALTWESIEKAYGPAVAKHLEQYYVIVEDT